VEVEGATAMNRDDIIRMAREAGFPDYAMGLASEDAWQKTERFAALVAAAERDRLLNTAELRRLHADNERLEKLSYDLLGELTALRAEKQIRAAILRMKDKP
jgi:hypothetical protein